MREMIPTDAPATAGYETQSVVGETGASVQLGVGHLHYSDENPVLDLPPGADDWLRRVILPLSESPGSTPHAWIAEGWILPCQAKPTTSECEIEFED